MTDDGGPAFPTEELQVGAGKVVAGRWPGMSLRDWFAGQFAGNLVREGFEVREHEDGRKIAPRAGTTCRMMAEAAYELADAMIKARGSK